MKKTIILLVILGLIGAFVFRPNTNPGVDSPVPTETVPQVVVVIDYPDKEDRHILLPIEGEQNAFSILMQAADNEGFDIETIDYDFGVFVQSIDGYESGADRAWIYYVNGQSGNVAADQYEVTNGDSVEWRYQEPQ